MLETSQSSWPGARYPTDHDVPQASRLPDRAFLSSFREALLAHEDSRDCRPLFHAHSSPVDSNGIPSAMPYTYPLGAFAGFPDLPPYNDLLRAQTDFANTLHKHVFLNKVPLRSGNDSLLPPDLLMARACIGSALTQDPHHDPAVFFHAAIQLCTFMVETDNRRSRSLDTILGVRGCIADHRKSYQTKALLRLP